MSSVAVEGVCKTFGPTTALDAISLDIEDTEFVTLLGPSGSGKTTLLRVIAGLIRPDSGDVLFDNMSVTRLPPDKRNIAMVFQDYALYPNMSVRDNISFCLKLQKTPRSEIARRLDAVADVLRIGPLLDRWPHELSGGQKQRVALGRAMVRQPRVFLLDEPLSNLDAKLRTAMRAELQKIHSNMRVTMVHVTHDQEEAMSVSQRVALINHGRVEQYGTPDDLYRRPANLMVAQFMGKPPMNILSCRLASSGKGWDIVGDTFSFKACGRTLTLGSSTDVNDLRLGIRPEDLTVVADPGPNTLRGEVTVVERLGRETLAYLATSNNDEIAFRAPRDLAIRVGQNVALTAKEEDFCFFDGMSGAALKGAQR